MALLSFWLPDGLIRCTHALVTRSIVSAHAGPYSCPCEGSEIIVDKWLLG